MRVLHLIDAASPQATSTTLAMLHDALGRLGHVEQRVVLLGGETLRASARAVGIEAGDVNRIADARDANHKSDVLAINVPTGRAMYALTSLKRRVRRAFGDERFDLVHCWSLGALTLATLLFRRSPRLLTLTTPPTRRQVNWLRGLGGGDGRDGTGAGGTAGGATGGVTLLPISNTIRRTLCAGGVNPDNVHVLRPAIDFSRIENRRRDELRDRWAKREQHFAGHVNDDAQSGDAQGEVERNAPPAGKRQAHDDGTRYVALISAPPTAVDAVDATVIAMKAADILARQGLTVRLVLHPDQRRRSLAAAMTRQYSRAPVHVTDAELAQPWRVLPGCDLALALNHDGPVCAAGPRGRISSTERPTTTSDIVGAYGAGASAEGGGGGLALLWAMAANIPIVGEATYAISEIVEDRHSALLVKPGEHRSLVHRICDVLTDPRKHWQLRDTARHEAYSFFSRRRYCDSVRVVYEQVVRGAPVEVPPLEVTGGLRFAGRA